MGDPEGRVAPHEDSGAPVMLTSGDKDTRVSPLQARKMTARLESATTSGRPVIFLLGELSPDAPES